MSWTTSAGGARGAPAKRAHRFRAPVLVPQRPLRTRRHRLDAALSVSRPAVTTKRHVRRLAGTQARIGALARPRAAAARRGSAWEPRALMYALAARFKVLSARIDTFSQAWQVPSVFTRQLAN